jgi:hypothetical protein
MTFNNDTVILDFFTPTNVYVWKDEYQRPRVDSDLMEGLYESLSLTNIKHLVLKEHYAENIETEEMKRDIVRKTHHSLVSLNFEIENNIFRKDEVGVYHCAEFVYNLLASYEFPLLESIGLKFDFVYRANL